MSEGPGLFRRVVLPVVLLGLTVLGLINTYGDATGVAQLAADTACGGTRCPVEMREYKRSPFSHEYIYAVGAGKSGSTNVTVECARAAIFLGDYACKKQ
jgi:hypothetical protein